MSEDRALRRALAEGILGHPIDDLGYAPCPGKNLHNSSGGRRDFQIVLDGAPTARCFHQSCAAMVDEFNAKLRSAIGRAESTGGNAPSQTIHGQAAPMPQPPRRIKRPPYDPKKLKEFAGRCPFPIDEQWLADRSPVAISKEQGVETAEMFLSALYQPDERVLIFTREFSQGDFLYSPGQGSFRLGDRPDVKAVPSSLPAGGVLGAWFLAAPVTGKWLPNENNRDDGGAPKLGRRHWPCVTAWRFMVLESDEAPADLWLRALVQLPLPIVAAYTSGGRSIHALVKVDASTKHSWDALRDDMVPILCPLGADPAAMTAVRLTRLPGLLRQGYRDKDGKKNLRYESPRLQRLLYLNPHAQACPILDLRA